MKTRYTNCIIPLEPGLGTGRGPCPGKFSVPGTEFRFFLISGTGPNLWVPVSCSSVGPSPESRIFQISVPIPNPANFQFESGSQYRILLWVPFPSQIYGTGTAGSRGTCPACRLLIRAYWILNKMLQPKTITFLTVFTVY